MASEYFTLEVSVAFCRCDVRVNDVPVLRQDVSDARVDVEVPLNQWVFTGDNVVSIDLTAPLDAEGNATTLTAHPDTQCAAVLYRRPYRGPRDARVAVTGIAYRGADVVPGTSDGTGSSPEGTPAVVVATSTPERLTASRGLYLHTPFPRWLWLRGERVAPTRDTIATLYDHYRRLWTALETRDVGTLRALLTENAREYQAAYYLSDLAAAHRALEVEALLTDGTVALDPLPRRTQLELYGDGRLAQLVDENGDPLIRFLAPDGSGGAFVTVMFCRVPGQGWVQIR